MKKGDFKILLICIALALLSFLALFLFKEDGDSVVISKDNKVVFEGSISENREIDLDTKPAVIKDGFVYMKDPSCKNQICVNTRKISSKGESIICLPNRVVIEIK